MALTQPVELQPLDRQGVRSLQVTWQEGGTTFVAEITRVGDIPRLCSFTIENATGLPVDRRRVPTESAVIDMVHWELERLRKEDADRPPSEREGVSAYWFYLMGASFHYDGSLADIDADVINPNLENFNRELFNRPHSRHPELIDTAAELLKQGKRTTDVVNALVGHGVSKATAYRYLRRAQAGETHLMVR
jgi:hypothetical protein